MDPECVYFFKIQNICLEAEATYSHVRWSHLFSPIYYVTASKRIDLDARFDFWTEGWFSRMVTNINICICRMCSQLIFCSVRERFDCIDGFGSKCTKSQFLLKIEEIRGEKRSNRGSRARGFQIDHIMITFSVIFKDFQWFWRKSRKSVVKTLESWQRSKGISTGRESGPKTLPCDLNDVWILDAHFSVVRFNYLVFPRHGGC